MAEYIEREALMRRIKEIHCAECDSDNGVRCRACWVDDTLDYIHSEPAADVEPVQQWIPVTERLPGREGKSQPWKKYNVVVLRSHWPTSSYDLCDAPYDEEIVTTASYDSEQKIWHLDWGAQLNALIDIEDSPLNGDYVTHWMPLPAPPKGE